MKPELHVLLLYYSQTGQLADIADSFMQPLIQAGVSVEKVRLYPEQDFPFPWTSERFFDAMPETVLGQLIPLQPFALSRQHYDLIVFAYQPWYLTLSMPALAILEQPSVKAVLKDAPVVTLIGARNMWLNSQQKVKAMLQAAEARLVGNVALVDKHANLISVVTILYWMMTGKKDHYLGVFPKPGVAEEDIRACNRFGKTVLNHLQQRNWETLQQELIAQHAVVVDADLMFVEERAPRLFSIWAHLITKRKNRKAWLVAFKYYLLIALFIVAPVVLLVNRIFFRIFFLKKVAAKKKRYQDVAY